MTVVSSNDVADAPSVVSVVSPPDVVPRATVNPVSGEPPLSGSGHVSCTCPLPAAAASTGAAGAVAADAVAVVSFDVVSPIALTAPTSYQ